MQQSPNTTPQQAHRLRVFLCHSHADKEAVRNLYKRLRAKNLEPWLDEEDLVPGQDWQLEIPKAVRASDIVLVCLSPNAINTAGYVHKEIKFALDVADEQPEGTIFIIPVKLEECEIPERLSRWHAVNLYEPQGFDRLMKALKARADTIQIKSRTERTPVTLHAYLKWLTDPRVLALAAIFGCIAAWLALPQVQRMIDSLSFSNVPPASPISVANHNTPIVNALPTTTVTSTTDTSVLPTSPPIISTAPPTPSIAAQLPATFTPMSINAPSPVPPADLFKYAAPSNISFQPEALRTNKPMQVQWSWSGNLAQHEHFEIRMKNVDNPTYSRTIAWADETKTTADARYMPGVNTMQRIPPGTYCWVVAIILESSGTFQKQLSPDSNCSAPFYFEGN
ncbi:MAG: toll/interleukin-1 receptor domain-containing protein [Anaerolineae bacterium]